MPRQLVAVCAECGIGVAVPDVDGQLIVAPRDGTCSCGAEDFSRYGKVAKSRVREHR